MPAQVGSLAPAFSLMDQDRNTVSLDDFKGKKTVVMFIPFPFTSICDSEGCTIRDRLAALNELDANVVIITCHAVPVAKKWSDENGFTFPVLSDFWPHGTVSTEYDAFNEKVGVANRMSFVVDSDGVIRTIIDSGSLGSPREFAEYVSALDKIN
jgi:peroxiredoxin (alkyl hydroperoxide reductase subunit C)